MNRRITVEVDGSTYMWLMVFAHANSETEMNPVKITAGELLAQAAFCIADYAGRRTGSWEADAGRNMMISSGYQAKIGDHNLDALHAKQEAANREVRKLMRLS